MRADGGGVTPEERKEEHHTFPTAASPRSTSFTLLLGFGAAPVESAILCWVRLFPFPFFFPPPFARGSVRKEGSKPV